MCLADMALEDGVDEDYWMMVFRLFPRQIPLPLITPNYSDTNIQVFVRPIAF
jgi:hypothetical protein